MYNITYTYIHTYIFILKAVAFWKYLPTGNIWDSHLIAFSRLHSIYMESVALRFIVKQIIGKLN